MNVWGRILRGKDQVRARRYIGAVHEQYANLRFYKDQFSFYEGYCGYYFLEAFLGKELNSPAANRALKKIPEFFHLPAAFWTHHYLQLEENVCQIKLPDFLRVLPTQVDKNENPDSITGLGTLALIASMSGRRGKTLLLQSLNRLHNLARERDDFIYWKASPDFIRFNAELSKKEEKEPFLVDLGVSHGQAGVISFLSWILISGHLKNAKAIALLKKMIASAINIYPEDAEKIPAFLVGKKERTYDFPGWCYGSISIGYSHMLAGKALGKNELVNRGADIIKSFADSKAIVNQQANSYLCHGTSGVAQVLARASELTQSKELFELTREWFHLTLDKSVNEETQDFGLMNSPVGTALSLFSAIEPVEPVWDRFMLLSNPYE